ncbi:hypothetical protein OH77DRAFT_1409076, partial [Trametes cingulata]
DICSGNALLAGGNEARCNKRVVARGVYVIYYHHSQQLQRRLGEQPATPTAFTQICPPLDMEYIDFYGWDAYCFAGIWGQPLKVGGTLPRGPVLRRDSSFLTS